MASGFVIRKGQYYDSVFLMGISKRMLATPGVDQAAVLMGTDANKGLLANIGVQDPRIEAALAADLIVAVVAGTQDVVDGVLGNLDVYLQGDVQRTSRSGLHALKDGLAVKPHANLAVISVPGEFAAGEARTALESGLNVFLFSGNMSIEDERDLKQLAARKGLLVMGPDCGTSLIGGAGIGFANAVRAGAIGVVGAAGTGLQEFTCQVHNAGLGISHAIGTGSHDLSDEVGGLTTLAGLDALEADPRTAVIAVISKPPGTGTLLRLAQRLKTCTKPVVACFLGVQNGIEAGPGYQRARSIDEAVRLSIMQLSRQPVAARGAWTAVELEWMHRARAAWSAEQRFLRGLFAGGTFCYQAQQILRDAGIQAYSNAPLDRAYKLANPDRSLNHTLVDMGDDYYTLGKPHPMIDGTLRRQRILAESRDPEVAVLLLDFILGYNASMDPAGELLDAIVAAQQAARRRGGALAVVASICGTDDDAQDVNLQSRMLEESGGIVFRSSARATNFCVDLLMQR